MKTNLTQNKFKSALSAGQLLNRVACLGAVILICSSASAQNLFVSGSEPPKNRPGCGVVYKFSWDGGQSIFASGLTEPWDMAFDSAGNLFVWITRSWMTAEEDSAAMLPSIKLRQTEP